MNLTNDKAKELILNPSIKNLLSEIQLHESNLRVITEELSENEVAREKYWLKLKETIKSRNKNKAARVLSFARFPLPCVQLSDSVLSDFFKVFEGKNRFFSVKTDRETKDLDLWLKETRVEQWIEKKARQVFKNKPNSFVVIDKDSSGTPYLIFIDSERLVDVKFKNEKGDLEYIIFKHSYSESENSLFYGVYDESEYKVFKKDLDTGIVTFVSETAHNLGYCPAKSFVSTQSNQKNPLKRRVAFSAALSKFEDFTLFDVFKNFLDHYAPFPVTEAPKKPCQNPKCVDGKVKRVEIIDAATNQTKTFYDDCEVCDGGNDDFFLPGTHIGVQVRPDNKNDGSGVFRMVTPDIKNLEYIKNKIKENEIEIRLKTTGINTILEKEAVNEKQVEGSFASMETVLLRTKKELDTLYKWIVKTASKILYPNAEVYIDANFGTEFYLVSEDELQARFQKAKEAGLPIEELLMIYEQIIETKYKGNSDKIKRQKMLLRLDPLPLTTVNEAVEMNAKNFVNDSDLTIKINFLNFIAKFEARNAPITEFGSALEPEKRIEIIKETLNIYANEKNQSKQSE